MCRSRGLSSFNYEADGLGFKYLQNVKQSTQVIDGESFNVAVIQGAISPERTGTLNFGPCILKAQLTVQKQRGRNGWPFDDSIVRPDVRSRRGAGGARDH